MPIVITSTLSLLFLPFSVIQNKLIHVRTPYNACQGRTVEAIKSRWYKVLRKQVVQNGSSVVDKQRFTLEEDERIISARSDLGNVDWTQIAHRFPGVLSRPYSYNFNPVSSVLTPPPLRSSPSP